MDSVEVPSSAHHHEREGDEVVMGSGGHVKMKIGSVARIGGKEHLGGVGEDEVHIASQANDIIIS